MTKQHYDPFKDEHKKKDPFFFRKRKKEFDEEKDTAEDITAYSAEASDTAEKSSLKSSNTPAIRPSKYPVSSLVVAGFWIRFVAFIIDLIVAKAFSSAIASPIIALLALDEGIVSTGLSAALFYLYFVLFTYFTNGQTLGKMITAIRVVHQEERQLSFLTVLIREGCCRLIQTSFMVLYLITPFTERKQNIGDYLADTYVVKDDLYEIEKENTAIFYAYNH